MGEAGFIDGSPPIEAVIEGFEGEWFDPYDIEGYLAEKGMHVDPTASFAEVEVAATMRVLGDRSRASSRATTPALSESHTSWKSLDAFDLNAAVSWNPDTAINLENSRNLFRPVKST